jgi:hypothetical protein
MIESSKDILFVTLAFCAIWLTVFLCWLLYYLMAAVRDVEVIMRQVKDAVEKIDHLAHLLHEKVERSAGAFAVGAQAAKEIVTWALKQRQQNAEGAPRVRRTKKVAADEPSVE